MRFYIFIFFSISLMPVIRSFDVNILKENAIWEPWYMERDCEWAVEDGKDIQVDTWLRNCTIGGQTVDDSLCEGPYKLVIPCGEFESIIGGEPAKVGEVTWQVFIELDDGDDQCGGTLIKHDWVLTAAHCFNKGLKKVTRITMGTVIKNGMTRGAVNTMAERIICHEDFNSRTLANDICLIKIPWLKYRGYASELELSSSPVPNDAFCNVAGWGYIDDMSLPDKLQVASILIIGREDCLEWYEKVGVSIPDNTICAGFASGGVDTCGGDSGGPLECNNVLQGITSFGAVDCGAEYSPGIYTDVSKFYTWIEDNIKNSLLDYHWSPWKEMCSVTCGEGEMFLSRVCLNKFNDTTDPSNCDGLQEDIDLCFLPECVEHSWTDWKGDCDVSCGEGKALLTRECMNKVTNKPAPPIANCYDNRIEVTAACFHRLPCEGGLISSSKSVSWGEWKESSCTGTCGEMGWIEKSRKCMKDTGEEVHFSECGELLQELLPCVLECKDNNWSEWTAVCSVTCGSGLEIRKRDCVDSEQNIVERKNCPGSGFEWDKCSLPLCGEGYHWTPWITACDVTCGIGIEFGTRTCLDKNDDIVSVENCAGNPDRTGTCSLVPCKSEYRWAFWITSPCDVTCGNGTKSGIRQCLDESNNVVPAENCDGSQERTETCSLPPCKEYRWTPWMIGACDVTCGNGTQKGTRQCRDEINNIVSNENCVGNSDETEMCSLPPCKVYKWGEWKISCSVTCGIGDETRTRSCFDEDDNIVDTSKCTSGSATEQGVCRLSQCKVYRWGPWKKACSVTCGKGDETNTRRCLDEKKNVVDNKNCNGRNQRMRSCTLPDCPKDILYNWGTWKDTCSVTCGSGIQTSRRNCLDEDNNVVGNSFCGQEPAIRRGTCRLQACEQTKTGFSWGEWIIISECTVSCGGGTEVKSRACQDPNGNIVRDSRCGIEDSFRLDDCNARACHGGGNIFAWGRWEPWSECTVNPTNSDRCDGYRTAFRSCMNGKQTVSPHLCSQPPENFKQRSCTPRGCDDSIATVDFNDWRKEFFNSGIGR